ncbi:hypothetical protein [Caenispirillum salinarum]|uniref:hypothetical protein n=1 Tax=Caenispirillum salinarum TaxID=859058 RepID=UPI00384EABA0
MDARRRRRQAGRTNTHTAVLVLIVGLLMVAVAWSGQDLYRAAQAFMTRQDIESVRSMVLRYHHRWNALPGDDPRAAARWGLPPPLTPAAGGASRDTTGNGRIDGPVLALVDVRTEGHMAWRHLEAGGSGWDGAWGRVGFARTPVNRYGGLMALTSGAFGLDGAALCLTSVPAEAARRLDARLDDGAAETGRVRAGAPDANGTLRRAALPLGEDRATVLCVGVAPSGA